MRAVETTPAASLNAEELSSGPVYPGLARHACLTDLESGCLAVLVRLRRCKVKNDPRSSPPHSCSQAAVNSLVGHLLDRVKLQVFEQLR